jgi:hypothetical protein
MFDQLQIEQFVPKNLAVGFDWPPKNRIGWERQRTTRHLVVAHLFAHMRASFGYLFSVPRVLLWSSVDSFLRK